MHPRPATKLGSMQVVPPEAGANVTPFTSRHGRRRKCDGPSIPLFLCHRPGAPAPADSRRHARLRERGPTPRTILTAALAAITSIMSPLVIDCLRQVRQSAEWWERPSRTCRCPRWAQRSAESGVEVCEIWGNFWGIRVLFGESGATSDHHAETLNPGLTR